MGLLASNKNDDEIWISASDMMAGLMMIFLFIAIIYIRNIGQYFDEINDVQSRLCSSLSEEFAGDKKEWNMTICEDGLVIRFESDGNFERSKSQLTLKFRRILSSFVPRFFDVVWQYQDQLSEVRIEGHTDSLIRRLDTPTSGYLYNTELSQDRSRKVMNFALVTIDEVGRENQLKWSFKNLTAHGMSSSDPILVEGVEQMDRSRRVEFRVRTVANDNLDRLVRDLRDAN